MRTGDLKAIDWEGLWEERMQLYLQNSKNSDDVWDKKARKLRQNGLPGLNMQTSF